LDYTVPVTDIGHRGSEPSIYPGQARVAHT
jgi:hypothetical protein